LEVRKEHVDWIQVAASSGQESEPSGEYINQLSNYQLSKKENIPCNLN
jgi:hypothetical protein